MKTTVKNSRNGGLLLTCLLMLTSFFAKADGLDKIVKNLTNDLSKGGFIGFYIIGGILAFGIIAFVIVSIYDKKHKDDDKDHTNVKHLSHHRHHHHHKIIKKSA
jgi:uncharacterized membrane protein